MSITTIWEVSIWPICTGLLMRRISRYSDHGSVYSQLFWISLSSSVTEYHVWQLRSEVYPEIVFLSTRFSERSFLDNSSSFRLASFKCLLGDGMRSLHLLVRELQGFTNRR